MEGGEKREIRNGNRDKMPNMQKGIHEPEDDETTHEDGTWGHPGIASM